MPGSTLKSRLDTLATRLVEGRASKSYPASPRSIVIIGSGFGGICAAIKLKELGVGSLTILERSDDVGGTWQKNRYPGVAVDTSILQYSLSFEPNPGWSRLYAPGNELQEYLAGLTRKYDLHRHIRFRTEVVEMRYLEDHAQWEITTRNGEILRADIVVNATGQLSSASLPDIPGLEDFQGDVLHSAEWDEAFEANGRRIAAIGTGATAAQLVPEVAKTADHIYVYQRSAPWVLPRDDRPIGPLEGLLFKHLPITLRMKRWRQFWFNDRIALAFERQDEVLDKQQKLALDFIERSIPDPDLRAAVTPDYSIGCKRRVMSDDWYPTLLKDNVELVQGALTTVTPTGVIGADGIERRVDTIIFQTGYDVAAFMGMKVYGDRGQELHDEWNETAQTYLGISTAGFPNLFIVGGPNTGIGSGSFAFMIESAVRYIVGAVDYLQQHEYVASLDVKPDVQHRFYWSLQSRLDRSVYGSGCVGWYRRANGRIDTLWPGLNAEYWWRTRKFDPDCYDTLVTAPNASAESITPQSS